MESGVDDVVLLKTRYTIIIFNTNSSLGMEKLGFDAASAAVTLKSIPKISKLAEQLSNKTTY